ncbi:aspartate carbamoyltransferase catalytic subunit [Marinicella gelatinilytica]|uniref:aspartate carbamoyltransferase catalytic subunit n=1 Tax=Marinicella gelatinilytica TaxID=2996017 RepID=UPI002260D496|nr:aspartate carbamoyltransferase catalytic subunit [Marinicella gelatinilytica]MCX7544252.1 aspartate carbamoyltransferase catalytic subunit [Marinicella gelatinilytica]
MKHLLDIKDLNQTRIEQLFQCADNIKSQPKAERLKHLIGRQVVCLFYENSTRTLLSFQLAASGLGASVFNLPVDHSSVQKGESFHDTIKTIAAMAPDAVIMRHPEDYAHRNIADLLTDNIHLINAGDGQNQHPTQALLDLYTIRRHKPDFKDLKVTIIGDIKHSRVANSLIDGLNILQTTDISLFGPDNLIPEQYSDKKAPTINAALDQADVVVMLRIQKERFEKNEFLNVNQWHQNYGLNSEKLKLAQKDAIVMHPGPMNRGIEISAAVADGPQSVILEQVSNGVLIRQAVMATLLS